MESDQCEIRELTNEVLWQRLRDGRKQALTKIFNRYFGSLYDYGYRIISNEGLVRDAIQEVFFSLWKYRENLDQVKSVRAYLFISLRRELLNNKASRARRVKRNKKYMSEEFEIFFDYEKWNEILEIKEERKRHLKKALNELSPRQREAIYLKYYEGLSTGELSRVMGIRAQSVYNLIVEAIKKLRIYLDS